MSSVFCFGLEEGRFGEGIKEEGVREEGGGAAGRAFFARSWLEGRGKCSPWTLLRSQLVKNWQHNNVDVNPGKCPKEGNNFQTPLLKLYLLVRRVSELILCARLVRITLSIGYIFLWC